LIHVAKQVKLSQTRYSRGCTLQRGPHTALFLNKYLQYGSLRYSMNGCAFVEFISAHIIFRAYRNLGLKLAYSNIMSHNGGDRRQRELVYMATAVDAVVISVCS